MTNIGKLISHGLGNTVCVYKDLYWTIYKRVQYSLGSVPPHIVSDTATHLIIINITPTVHV